MEPQPEPEPEPPPQHCYSRSSEVVERPVQTAAGSDAYYTMGRSFERDRDAVDARLWETHRTLSQHRRTGTTAGHVERDTRARLEHLSPDDIAAWQPAARSARPRSVPAAGYYAASGPHSPRSVSATVALIAARDLGERRDTERRAFEAEHEVARLSEELSACCRELDRSRQLAGELKGAMRHHHRDLALHHRRQVAGEIRGKVLSLKQEQQQLRASAALELCSMSDWLTNAMAGLDSLVGRTITMAKQEHWHLQRSLQSHLDNVRCCIDIMIVQ